MWRSIDTAPKDGTEFLGWGNDQYHIVQSHGFERSEGGHAWFNGDVYVHLTHWQPLPSPPGKGATLDNGNQREK